jgi:ZIP family zinc transporter
MILLAIAPAAFLATLIGGLLALFLRDKLHLVLGFSAGAVVGVAFFDLLPEVFAIGREVSSAKVMVLFPGLGFLIYLVLDRLLQEPGIETAMNGGTNSRRGMLGAASLVTHSAFDGIAIGLAFQVSTEIGAVVTAAVLAHDFADGINTANIVLKHGGSVGQAFRWLLADALAPVLGIALTLFIHLPETWFGLVIALFAGFFLYLGASELVPDSHNAYPKRLTTVGTVLGAALVFATTQMVG